MTDLEKNNAVDVEDFDNSEESLSTPPKSPKFEDLTQEQKLILRDILVDIKTEEEFNELKEWVATSNHEKLESYTERLFTLNAFNMLMGWFEGFAPAGKPEVFDLENFSDDNLFLEKVLPYMQERGFIYTSTHGRGQDGQPMEAYEATVVRRNHLIGSEVKLRATKLRHLALEYLAVNLWGGLYDFHRVVERQEDVLRSLDIIETYAQLEEIRAIRIDLSPNEEGKTH